jgi:glycerophosphoryl diester phosphodiesterase
MAAALARVRAMSLAPRDFALIGHRGARGLFPENTIEGFAATLALGVKMIELDVAVTADDVIVVSHDPSLNPDLTRDGRGDWLGAEGPPIRQLRFDTLRDYDVGRIKPGSDYARRFSEQSPIDGARIPSLAEVLTLDPRIVWAIELKSFPQHPDLTIAPESMADLVVAVAEAQNATARIILQSFDWRGLDHARRRYPQIALAWLTEKKADRVSSALRRVAAAAQGAPNALRWMPQFAALDAHTVDEAQAQGLAVIPWDVNDAAAIERALAWNVDGIITDRPDIALRLLRAR